jgi:ABC-type glycerol-3-phosphate transport system permease component
MIHMGEAVQTKESAPLQPLVSRIFLIGMSLFYISPIYWMFVTALKSDKELANFPPTLWPKEIVWGNFEQAPELSLSSPT